MLIHDGRTTKPEKVGMQVEVKPGFFENTALSFLGKGNEAHSHKPSKLIIKFT